MGEIEQVAEDREEPHSAMHILRVLPMVVVLGLVVHFVLPRIDTIESALQTIRTMKPWGVLLAFVMESLSYVANGALLQSIVALMGERISLRRSAAIEIGAGTVAVV